MQNRFVINTGVRAFVFKTEASFGELLPSPEDVAETIVREERIHIRPSAAYALHKLGISTPGIYQISISYRWAGRKINIGKTQISFKPATARKMALKGALSSLVIQAVEELEQARFQTMSKLI